MSQQERRITLARGGNSVVPTATKNADLGLITRWRLRSELAEHARRSLKIDNSTAEAAQAIERTAAVYAYGNHAELSAIDAMGRTVLEFGPESLVSEVGDQIVERNVNRLDQTIERITERFSNTMTRAVDRS